jgi:hypothetical protein
MEGTRQERRALAGPDARQRLIDETPSESAE